MPEKEKKRRDDLDEKEKKGPSPFDEKRKIDEDIIKDIDDIVKKTGEETVEERRDEEGE